MGKNNKRDVIVLLICVAFMLMNLGTIGNSGRRRAKEIVCLSNLNKWGSLFDMFTNDNGGYFHAGVGDGHTNHWFNALRSYYHNDHRICCCPTAVTPLYDENGNYSGRSTVFSAWGIFDAEDDVGYDPNGDWGSYGINGWAENPPPEYQTVYENYDTMNNWRTPNVANADTIPLFADAIRYSFFPRETDTPPAHEDDLTLTSLDHMKCTCVNRHEGAINCLFLDFSARKVGLKELWTLKWHRRYNTQGPWTKAGGIMSGDWPYWMKNFKEF